MKKLLILILFLSACSVKSSYLLSTSSINDTPRSGLIRIPLKEGNVNDAAKEAMNFCGSNNVKFSKDYRVSESVPRFSHVYMKWEYVSILVRYIQFECLP